MVFCVLGGARFLRSIVSIELLAIQSGWFVFPLPNKTPQSNLSCVFSGSAFRFFPKAHSAHLAVRLIPVAEIGNEILKLFFATKQTPFYFGVGG